MGRRIFSLTTRYFRQEIHQMIPRLIRWTAPATLTSAMLALTACAGGNWSAVPSAQGSSQIASVGVNQAHIAILNAQPNVTCPKQYLDCDTVSQKHGALLIWCYGPSSDPCSDSDAGEVTWSGVVCLAKGGTCKKPIKQLTAAWSGPFKCKAKDKCKGTYELDTISPGPGLKQTKSYLYKQDIHICASASCEDAYVGLNVGP
jgi:hypothetical protein